MARYYITHTDDHGERHQLAGAYEAATPTEAIAKMLVDSRATEDDGRWIAHVVTDDRDIIE